MKTNRVLPRLSRRDMLQMTGLGFGSLALSWVNADEAARASDAAPSDLQSRPGHFPP